MRHNTDNVIAVWTMRSRRPPMMHTAPGAEALYPCDGTFFAGPCLWSLNIELIRNASRCISQWHGPSRQAVFGVGVALGLARL